MSLTVSGLPFPLTPSAGSQWDVNPVARTVSVTAAPHSDIFVDPAEASGPNATKVLNAVTLLGTPPEGDFRLWARVTVDFASTFDAGVLLLWLSETHWAKLCFEFAPAHEPMVVSVVAKGGSDDANAFVVNGDSVWLRLSRTGNTYALHSSFDGTEWRFVRLFALDEPGTTPMIGFLAQSPTGDGCDVLFDQASFDQVSLTDFRDGS